MICKNCGKEIPDNVKFCTYCGAQVSLFAKGENMANQFFDRAEKDVRNAAQDVYNEFKGGAQNGYQNNGAQNGYQDGAGGYQNGTQNGYRNGYQTGGFQSAYSDNYSNGKRTRLQTDRSLIAYIFLSIITCGIYGYYFIYKMAKDVNIACEEDGENTAGLVKFIILSFITCGIYTWFWYYNLGNRLAKNAPRYGLYFQENGTTVLLWLIFGSLLCGIGVFVAFHILIKNSNAICAAYNARYGL